MTRLPALCAFTAAAFLATASGAQSQIMTEAEAKALGVSMANHMFVCEYMTSGQVGDRQFKFYLTLGFAYEVTDEALNTTVQTGTFFKLEGRDYRRSSVQKGKVTYAGGKAGIVIGEQVSWKGDDLPYGLTWTGVSGDLAFSGPPDRPALHGALRTQDGQYLFLNCPMVK